MSRENHPPDCEVSGNHALPAACRSRHPRVNTRGSRYSRTPFLPHSSTPLLLLLTLIVASHVAAADSPNYEQHIRPLFRDYCLKCHNADESNADLDLSSYAAVMQGGSAGVVVKPGQPESSQLYRAMAHLDGAEAMPPESPPLAKEKLELVRRWISGGLIAGKGGKSQLKPIAAMLAVTKNNVPSPLPENLPAVSLAPTTRPPIPQALAASPGVALFAVSGQEQVLLFRGEKERSGRGEEEDKSSTPPLPSSPTPPLKFLAALPFPEGTIHDVTFSSNGVLLLAAGGRGAHSGRVVLFDVKTGKRAAEIGDETDSVLAADMSSDHRFVALGGTAKVVRIFDARTGEVLHRIARHTDWVTAVAFSPDGKLVATGDRTGGVCIWEAEPGAIVFSLNEHKVRITDLAWRPDGSLLASASDDGSVILWSMKDGFPVRNIVAHKSSASPRYSRRIGVLALDFAPDGRLLTAGRDGQLRIWSPEGEPVLNLPVDSSLPVSAAFLNDPGQAIVGTFDGSLHVYDLSAGKPVQLLSTAPKARSGVGETRSGGVEE